MRWVSQTAAMTRSTATCKPSAVAASARPCKRSSTALRRLPLRLHVTTAAVSGASQFNARTGTRRQARSEIACAASRLSGTSRKRPPSCHDPAGQNVGNSAATASQSTQKTPPTVGRSSLSLANAFRTDRAAANRPSTSVAGARRIKRSMRPGRAPEMGSKGDTKARSTSVPCRPNMNRCHGNAIVNATPTANRPAANPGGNGHAARHQGRSRSRTAPRRNQGSVIPARK